MITLRLYDPGTGELTETLSRSFVPWRLAKSAVKLQSALPDDGQMTTDDIDAVTELVAAFFGLTPDEVESRARIEDVIPVFTQILSLAFPQAQNNAVGEATGGNASRPGRPRRARA